MSPHGSFMSNLSANNSDGLDPCQLESHTICKSERCEVHEIAIQAGSAQLKVGLATAIFGLLVSTACALAIVAVWVHSYLSGKPMPDIPLIISSIATATFAAGTITTLKIPKKAKLKITSKE